MVGCGAGTLFPQLIGRTVTVDGAEGLVLQGALTLRRSESGSSTLLDEVQRWAEKRSPLHVVASLDPQYEEECLDLDENEEALDPASVASVLSRLYALNPKRFVRGGAINTVQGIQAAIELGVEAIVCEPRLLR